MLEINSGIRYKSLGAGIVKEHLTRDFNGDKKVFAKIYFPHRDMSAQIPLNDPMIEEKLEELIDADELKEKLAGMEEEAVVLSRAWDIRSQQGEAALKDGGPEEWIKLLGSYAYAEGSGVEIAASDDDLVRQAEELLASELCCSLGKNFDWAIQEVKNAYQQTVANASEKRKEKAEHFAAVEV